MPRTRIKICGIRNVSDALAAAQAGADAIGLVFERKSPRHVTPEQARAIVAALPVFVEPVGLFVDAAVEQIRRACHTAGLHTVQLHGCETIDHARQLNDYRVIKAVAHGDAKFDAWFNKLLPGHIVALLLDAPAALNAASPDAPKSGLAGGGGKTFDWSTLASLDRDKLPPLILAGGLTAKNVGEAVRAVKPFAVDVSSGVESSRGVKEAKLIQEFCDAVRAAEC